MRVRVALIALFVAAACGCAGTCVAAPAVPAVTIPVVYCPTWFGFRPSPISPPKTRTLHGVPASTTALVAYTNTNGYLIAPPQLRCNGLDGGDGTSMIEVWPRGQARPTPNGAGAGLSASLLRGCLGCKAKATCHYFSAFRRYIGQFALNCRPEPPPGERVRYLSKRLVAFVDPRFVKGAGWPSGAGLQATGLVGIRPGAGKVVFTSSCTLPAAQRAVCVDSADAARSLYGRAR
jgi:hypothetical protein